MDKDISVYACELVERIINLKDRYKSVMNRTDIDTLNDAANIIYHNRKELKEP